MKDDQQTDVRNEVMNRVIQIWKLKNLDIVDKNTIKTRIMRLLKDADKLGKFTRDMKKPEFIATQQAKYDVIFDISATPNKNPVSSTTNRGYRELLDGRLCRPDSEQRPLVSNFTTVAIVKLCCHNFTQIANFIIFFVSTISYRPTD